MEPCDRDNLDQWLDRALQKYGQAPPTVGLEGRILTHLAERRTPALAANRWLGFASMAALAGMLAVLWFGRTSHPRIENRPSVAARIHLDEVENPRKDTDIIRRSQAAASARTAFRQRRILQMKLQPTPTPKLDQFPSPRPLSPEEEMLKQYVREFPEEAALMAREQAQLATEREQWFAQNTQENRPQEER